MAMMWHGTDTASPSDLLYEASAMSAAMMASIEKSTVDDDEREGLMLFLLEIRARIDAARAADDRSL